MGERRLPRDPLRSAPRRTDDLRSHTLILPTRELARIPPARWLERMSRGAPPPLRCNTMPGQLAMTKAGLGISCLPHYVTQGDLDVRALLPRARTRTSDLWLLTHRDLRISPPIRAVLDALTEAYRKEVL